jgi:hypothetical protein
MLSVSIENIYAQPKDSSTLIADLYPLNNPVSAPVRHSAPDLKPAIRTLVVPLSLITYGAIAQSSEDLREFDLNVKTEIRKKDPDFHTPFDNYLQYAPGLSVYALNAMGIKGEHNFKDRTVVFALTTVISGITVQSIKAITKVVRPDGRGTNAFPSGHTATAFAGAEFLRQEYKNVSPWYGIAGYTAATATGILRMYNNKHWFRDVVAGAGFGVLSTKVAYWLLPVIEKKLFPNKPKNSVITGY